LFGTRASSIADQR